MKKKCLFLALFMVLLVVLSACGGNKYASNGSAELAPMPAEKPMDPGYDYGYSTDSPENYVPGKDIYTDINSKIIRTANLTIQTTEFDAAIEALNQLTEECGGYYEQADVRTGSYYNQYANRYGYYTVRIPKENFIRFRDSTGNIGHVFSISENNQNVGEAYYDTETRLATLTTKRERLLSLLDKADNMEDIISLETALADVQYQIDMHTSTLRRYDSLIDYSTFNINLEEVIEIKEEAAVTASFGSRLSVSFKRGLENFGEGIRNFLLWFVGNIIGILIFAVIVVLVVVVIRKTHRAHRARKQKKTEE